VNKIIIAAAGLGVVAAFGAVVLVRAVIRQVIDDPTIDLSQEVTGSDLLKAKFGSAMDAIVADPLGHAAATVTSIVEKGKEFAAGIVEDVTNVPKVASEK
jgi:hypothetical protein